MRLSQASLALLVGSAVAFVPRVPRNAAGEAKQVSNGANGAKHSLVRAPRVSNVSSVVAPSKILKRENIAQARGCLEEIEMAAQEGRNYLAFLNQVAQVVRSYLDDQSTPLRANLDVPEMRNVEEAREYLLNIEIVSDSALEYLEYLKNTANGIKIYIEKFEEQIRTGNVLDKNVKQANEAKIYLEDLEETARAAREYLTYLRTVADVVQQYLVDPNLEGIERFMPVSVSIPEWLSPRAIRVITNGLPKKAMPKKPTPKITSTTPIEDLVPSDVTRPELFPSEKTQSILVPSEKRQRVVAKPRIIPPPAPALEVDTSAPRQTIRILPDAAMEIATRAAPTGASYLDSLRLSVAAQPDSVSGGNMGYLNTLASQPRRLGIPTSSSGGTGAYQTYLGAIVPSIRKATQRASKRNAASGVESPTRHYEAVSTDRNHIDDMDDDDGSYFAKLGSLSASFRLPGAFENGYLDGVSEPIPGRGLFRKRPRDSIGRGASLPGTTRAQKAVAKASPSPESYSNEFSTANGVKKPVAQADKTAHRNGIYLDQIGTPSEASVPSAKAPSDPQQPAARGAGSSLDRFSSINEPTRSFSEATKSTPNTESYLDHLSTSKPGIKPVTKGSKTAPRNGTYLDQVGTPVAAGLPPGKVPNLPQQFPVPNSSSSLEQFLSSKPAEPVTNSQAVSPNFGSYLDDAGQLEWSSEPPPEISSELREEPGWIAWSDQAPSRSMKSDQAPARSKWSDQISSPITWSDQAADRSTWSDQAASRSSWSNQDAARSTLSDQAADRSKWSNQGTGRNTWSDQAAARTPWSDQDAAGSTWSNQAAARSSWSSQAAAPSTSSDQATDRSKWAEQAAAWTAWSDRGTDRSTWSDQVPATRPGSNQAAAPSTWSNQAAAPSTGSYLDQSSSANSVKKPVANSKKIAPSTGSYLDQVGSPVAPSDSPGMIPFAPRGSFAPDLTPVASVGSYVDQFPSAKPVEKPVARANEVPPRTGSYMDRMHSPAARNAPPAKIPEPPTSISRTPKQPVAPSAGSSSDTAPRLLSSVKPVQKHVTKTKKAAPTTGKYLDQVVGLTASTPPKRATAPKKASPVGTSYLDRIRFLFQRGKPVDLSRDRKKKAAPISGVPSYLDDMPQPSQPVGWPGANGSSFVTKKTPGTGSLVQDFRPTPMAGERVAPKYFYLEQSVRTFFFGKLAMPGDIVPGLPHVAPTEPIIGSKYVDQLERAAHSNPTNVRDELEKRRHGIIPGDSIRAPGEEIRGSKYLERAAPRNPANARDELEKRRYYDDEQMRGSGLGTVWEEEEEEGVFGFTQFAEMVNGRVAMFFLVFGLVVELLTGMTFPVQFDSTMQVLHVPEGIEYITKTSSKTYDYLVKASFDGIEYLEKVSSDGVEKVYSDDVEKVSSDGVEKVSSDASEQQADVAVDATAQAQSEMQNAVPEDATQLPETSAETPEETTAETPTETPAAEIAQSSMEVAQDGESAVPDLSNWTF